MIGNFVPSFSTESDRKWTFENLGHKVITFQENKTTSNILKAFLPRLDMLIYSHTHGWGISGLKEVFKEAKKQGVPTVSVHLDRWAWLEREADIGKEATWFTEYIFMADGSPEAVELYEKYKLNWFYLRPGVIERDCYMAEPNPTKYPHEIVFVGSKEYHPEYPFRDKLIEFLQETYGYKFGHYGKDGLGVVRGDDLNTLYATAKISIGDSCFGGRRNYVSDRYFETRGRGGFLLHPHVEGLETNGVAPYQPEDLQDLKNQIDYYLKTPYTREQERHIGFTYVKNNETYTHRAKELLRIVDETQS